MVEKMMWLTFTADLKVVLAATLEGKSVPSNMAAEANHTTLLKNQSALHLSNFGCKITFMRCQSLTSAGFQSLSKGSIGHMTS